MGTKFCRRLTAFVFSAVSVMILFFIPVFADDVYPVWIGGQQLTSSNVTGEGWSCVIDETGATIYLENASISGYSNAIYSDVPLTVVLAGENTLVSTNDPGIRSRKLLTVKGKGSLNVKGGNQGLCGEWGVTICDGATVTAEGSYGIYIETGEITINGSTVIAKGGSSAVYNPGGSVSIKDSNVECISGSGRGIYSGTLTIDNCTVTAKGGSSAINSNGSVSIKDSNVECISESEHGINSKTLDIYNSKVIAKGGILAIYSNYSSVSINDSNVACFSNNQGMSCATLTIDNSTVSVEAPKYNGITATNTSLTNGSILTVNSYYCALSSTQCSVSNSSLDIECQYGGAMNCNTLEVNSGYFHAKSPYDAVYSLYNFTLGDCMQIVTPENGEIQNTDGEVKIVDSEGNTANEVLIKRYYNIYIEDDDPGLIAYDKRDAFEGQTVTIYSRAHETGLYVLEGLTVTDESGNKLPLTDLGNGKYSFTMPASNVTVKPVYDVATTYPVSIEGISLHSRYTSGDGWSYAGDETGGTLTLDNADLSGNLNAIGSNVPLTIVLNGKNKITSNMFGIMVQSSLVVKGNGSLDLTATVGIASARGLTISNGAIVNAEGSHMGLYNSTGDFYIIDSTVISNGDSYGIQASGSTLKIVNSNVTCSTKEQHAINSKTTEIENSTVSVSGKVGMNVQEVKISKGSKVTASCIASEKVSCYDSTIVVDSENDYGLSVCDLTIDGGMLSVTVGEDAEGYAVMAMPNGIHLGENMVIVTPENGKLNDDMSTIVDADGNPVKKVVIKQSYKVTVTADKNGKATSSVTTGVEGTTITLTATPNDGYEFKEWQVINGGIKIKDSKNATTTFTIGTADVEVKAIFAAKPTPAPQVTLKLDKKSASVICGNTTSIKATLTGSKDKVTWKSSDTKIATVDANGKVTTKMAGTVTITASAAGKKAACTVTVLYKDVTDSKEFWYAPTNYLTKNGIVKGYDNQTLFKPANECSRAQMVTFLWRLAGQPNPKKTTTDFKDIKTTDYFYKPVLWAVENGITTGVSKEKFNPRGICTRAQTVTFLWRMAGKPAPKTKTSKFTDIDSKDYFYKATLWASEMKIVAGYDDNTFRPQGKCLRRQMVTFLYKYDKYINGKG